MAVIANAIATIPTMMMRLRPVDIQHSFRHARIGVIWDPVRGDPGDDDIFPTAGAYHNPLASR
jgi:hypothetical protein